MTWRGQCRWAERGRIGYTVLFNLKGWLRGSDNTGKNQHIHAK